MKKEKEFIVLIDGKDIRDLPPGYNLASRQYEVEEDTKMSDEEKREVINMCIWTSIIALVLIILTVLAP